MASYSRRDGIVLRFYLKFGSSSLIRKNFWSAFAKKVVWKRHPGKAAIPLFKYMKWNTFLNNANSHLMLFFPVQPRVAPIKLKVAFLEDVAR